MPRRTFATLLLVASSAFSTSNGDACISTLNEIHESEAALEDNDEGTLRTYVLCPNTEFPVATTFDDDGIPLDGQYPIPISRSNINIQCGDDGSCFNNCTLSGGVVQLGVYDEFDIGESITNAHVQGLTFTGASSVNIFAEADGSVHFEDCIFEDNNNFSPVFASAPGSANEFLELIFEKCVFRDNVAGGVSDELSTGILTNFGASLTIVDCAFMSTTNGAVETELPYVIFNYYGSLELSGNCFIGNDEDLTLFFNHYGMIQATSSFVQSSTDTLPPTGCRYIANVDSGEFGEMSFSDLTFSCGAADLPVCASELVRGEDYPCTSSLDDIYASEVAVVDSNVARTYVLCPGTTYRVTEETDLIADPEFGQRPIVVGRPNMRVLCGADGSRENMCVLSGGQAQVRVFDAFATGGEAASNIEIRGMWFSEVMDVNVFVELEGDVLMHDCLFLNNNPMTGIIWIHPAVENPPADSTLVTLEKCTFMDNLLGNDPGMPSGLVTNFASSLEVWNSSFSNTGSNAAEDSVSYLIASIRGELVLSNNRFSNNNVTVPVINQGGNVVSTGNSGCNSTSTICEFVGDVTQGDLLTSQASDVEVTCEEDFEQLGVGSGGFGATVPSQAPSWMSSQPSMMPSALSGDEPPSPAVIAGILESSAGRVRPSTTIASFTILAAGFLFLL